MDNRRSQKVFFQFVKLSAELLQIEPLPRVNSHSRDLSVELASLKTELAEYNLKENEDYATNHGEYKNTDPEYHLDFKGKSCVVRALYTLPVNLIDFSTAGYGHSRPENKLALEKIRYQYALGLNRKTCFYSEIHCVESAQATAFMELKNNILEVHKNFEKTKSPVIDQLKKDIAFISARQDPLFDNTNFQLLLAALYHAKEAEKGNNNSKNSLVKLFNHSKLQPEYEALITQYASLAPTFFISTRYNTEFEALITSLKNSYGLIPQENEKLVKIHGKNQSQST